MTTYHVHIGFFASQHVEVEADTVAEAVDLALDQADSPNISNSFEIAGDHYPESVYDTDNKEVWAADSARFGLDWPDEELV